MGGAGGGGETAGYALCTLQLRCALQDGDMVEMDALASLYLKMHLGKTWRIRPFERGDTAAKHHVLCNTMHCGKFVTFVQTGLFLFVRN